MRYGLLGEKLGHSHSPVIYSELGIDDYRLFEVPPDGLEPFLRGGGLAGLNVTIPYKKRVLPFCDTLTETARRLGNVNLLLFDGEENTRRQHRLRRLPLLRRAGIDPGKRSCAVAAPPDGHPRLPRTWGRGGGPGLPPSPTIWQHSPPRDAHPGERHPVGMQPWPTRRRCPGLHGRRPWWTLTNPEDRAPAGSVAAGDRSCGPPMLVSRAVAAGTFLVGYPPGKSEEIHAALLRAVENIVLVGMPGSGKTSVAERVARETGRKRLDTDEMVRELTGRDPADLIERDGEGAFRRVEEEVIRKASGESGSVIATGGGAVLSGTNRAALRRNGRVYWLDRPLADLPLEGRPLSKDLDRLYEERRPLYGEAADVRIDASRGVLSAARAILEEFYAHTGA